MTEPGVSVGPSHHGTGAALSPMMAGLAFRDDGWSMLSTPVTYRDGPRPYPFSRLRASMSVKGRLVRQTLSNPPARPTL